MQVFIGHPALDSKLDEFLTPHCRLHRSLGGYLAASYALLHPERVEHLVLVCPAGIPEKPDGWESRFVTQKWTIRSQLFKIARCGDTAVLYLVFSGNLCHPLVFILFGLLGSWWQQLPSIMLAIGFE